MSKRLSVHTLDPNDPAKLEQLFESLLEHKAMPTGSPRLDPLIHTLKHAHSLGAACAIVQEEVQDPDFIAEHEAYYSKWSSRVSRYCKRVHLFSSCPTTDDPLDAIDAIVPEGETAYLGFVTLRPITVSPVAATILRPTSGTTTQFVIAKDSFNVNLTGHTFTVTGTPYLQQDNAVGACAQASIWMALRTLRRKEGHSAFSPAQITSAATRFLVNGRTLPNRSGLRLEQMTEAIRAAGYSPHLIPLRSVDKPATDDSVRNAQRALYPYVESGIPVVIALMNPQWSEGHAVLLVGHCWNPPSNLSTLQPIFTLHDQDGKEAKLYDASDWAQPFLIHNDNTGPYLQLPATGSASYSLSDAVSAVPFLPSDVFIDGSEARLACFELIRQSLGYLPPDLVVRIYLQDRSEFRSAVLCSTMNREAKRYYREKWLPRRVWVMELNAVHEYEKSPAKKSRRLGEIVLDPAAEPMDGHFLSIHLTTALLRSPDGKPSTSGIMIDRNAFDGQIQAAPIANDDPYEPFVH